MSQDDSLYRQRYEESADTACRQGDDSGCYAKAKEESDADTVRFRMSVPYVILEIEIRIDLKVKNGKI